MTCLNFDYHNLRLIYLLCFLGHVYMFSIQDTRQSNSNVTLDTLVKNLEGKDYIDTSDKDIPFDEKKKTFNCCMTFVLLSLLSGILLAPWIFNCIGKGSVDQKVYSFLKERLKKNILFLQALSGYNSTSAIFQKDNVSHEEREITSVCFHILHKYDRKNLIQNQVSSFREKLTHNINHLNETLVQKGINSSISFKFKTIDSELPTISTVDGWLNAIKLSADDGFFFFLHVDSKVEKEEEDIIENLLYSELKDKFDKIRHEENFEYSTSSKESTNVASVFHYDLQEYFIEFSLKLCYNSAVYEAWKKYPEQFSEKSMDMLWDLIDNSQ